MNGYKTVVAGLISIVSGIVTAFGLDIPPDTLAMIQDNLNLIIGAGMSLYGAIMIVLRAFTKTPMFNKEPKQ